MSFSSLDGFLTKHQLRSQKGEPKCTSTHTRIGDKKKTTSGGIHGGNYAIPECDKDLFWRLYHDKVFVQKMPEYLTECQMKTGGPILVDFDFRYKLAVTERQHTPEHIQDMINQCYLEALKSLLVFDGDQRFDIFVFEKDDVNRLIDKDYTKDGVHMVIGIQMDHILQQLLRTMVVGKVEEVWDLPIINTWEGVFDEGISKGSTNWQVYGSRKPDHEPYRLTQHWSVTYDTGDGEFMMTQKAVSEFNMEANLHKLSAQYTGNCLFEIHKSVKEHYLAEVQKMETKAKRKSSSSSRIKLLPINLDEDDDDDENIPIALITCKDVLLKEIDKIMSSLKTTEYQIRETHDFTQILPPKYWEPGSHLLNRGVAFALKNTDDRLFLSWVLLRSKADDFDYDSIPDLYRQWSRYFKDGEGCITRRSIMYWAKQDAFEAYCQIVKSSIDYYIDQTLTTGTDYDLAMVLYQKYKDKYVCSSLTHKSWFVFRNHRWEKDLGNSLRLEISRGMYEEYFIRATAALAEMTSLQSTDSRYDQCQKISKYVTELCTKLKKTEHKNNIFREASEIFYDRHFENEMDANKNLMCFTNGVVDMKNRIFRPGNAQDYITKCTGIPYIPFDISLYGTEVEEINTFMSQLFPDPELMRYMWDHLSSVLIGENINQTFNIYRGSGSNGKSILTDLMSRALGEYKGTVPITLVTEKRNCIGGTSSEVIQLKGIRYAVMQEPSKHDRLNEGVLKELTGGDPIQARALYAESCIFTPQFSLVVCTNIEFEISSNDDGTWRRIRMIDFKSKFVDVDEEQSIGHGDQVFPKDKALKDKLPRWAPIFASLLVKRVFETAGVVVDCAAVMSSSKKYRQGQDTISQFVQERIKVTVGESIVKSTLLSTFSDWHKGGLEGRKAPRGSEIVEYMDKKFGTRKRDTWKNVELLNGDGLSQEDP